MSWEVEIRNVGGIRSGSVTLEPGVNAVRGTNSQGKSSFLAAIETAMGTRSPLTEGAEEGYAELRTDDGVHRVELHRENGTVVSGGDPYLDDEADVVGADLYAFLDEHNPVRRAVRNGENLADVLTRPLEFEDIDDRIATAQRERERVDAALDRATTAADRLPDVETRIARLESNLDELRERRDELREGTDALSERREELSDCRAERDRVSQRVERLEESVERVREELDERRAELSALTVPDDPDDALDEQRERLRDAERDAELLQSVYAANRRVLDEDRLDLLADVDRGVLGDEVTCWLCSGETDRESFDDALRALGDRVTELQAECDDRRERLSELERRRDDRRERREREATLEDAIAEREAHLDERRESLESARERLDSLDDRVETLAEAVATDDDRLTDVESERKYVRAELEDAREERSTLAERAAERDSLRDEREELAAEIERLRERKDAVRRRTREAFQAAVRDVLDRVDTGFETARLTTEYELVVARDGREANLDALSESELELLGIVAALAGYEAFDVADAVPVLLVDRLGGIADDNLRTLVAYLRDRATFLVFTTFPESAPVDGHEIRPNAWTTVSVDRRS